MAAAQVRRVELGAGVRAGFSLRAGGTSAPPFDSLNVAVDIGDDPDAVAANRSRLAAATGAAPLRVLWAEQVHGGEVAVVTGHETGDTVAGVDALVTSARGVLLCIRVADCLPVLLADSAAGVVGVAHAGRRGLVAGVLANTVAAMESLGASPAGLRVSVGPGICGGCYEVPEELAAEVEAVIPGTRTQTRQATPSLDLRRAALTQLTDRPLTEIFVSAECTVEQPDRWYSYRRDSRTGRFCGYVVRG